MGKKYIRITLTYELDNEVDSDLEDVTKLISFNDLAENHISSNDKVLNTTLNNGKDALSIWQMVGYDISDIRYRRGNVKNRHISSILHNGVCTLVSIKNEILNNNTPTEEDLISEYYEPALKGEGEEMTLSEIIDELQKKSTITLHNNKLGMALKRLGFVKSQKSSGKWVYYINRIHQQMIV